MPDQIVSKQARRPSAAVVKSDPLVNTTTTLGLPERLQRYNKSVQLQ